jgi:hypothetical protein
MAKIEGRATLQVSVIISLNEAEMGALDALAGYGVDTFLKVFYEQMGRSYLEPHEAGLRSLFESVRSGPAAIGNVLSRADKARKVFNRELIL